MKVMVKKAHSRRAYREIQHGKGFITAHQCCNPVKTKTCQRHATCHAVRTIHEVVKIGHPHDVQQHRQHPYPADSGARQKNQSGKKMADQSRFWRQTAHIVNQRQDEQTQHGQYDPP